MNIAAPLRRSRVSRPISAPPLRLTPALCGAIAALSCLWMASGRNLARGEETLPIVKPSSSVVLLPVGDAEEGALLKLRVGRSLSFPLPAGAKYSVQGDTNLVRVEERNELLIVTASKAGHIGLSIALPPQPGELPVVQKYSLRIASETAGILTDLANVNPGHDGETALTGNNADAASESGTPESGAIVAGVAATRIPPRQPAFTTASIGVSSAVANPDVQPSTLRNFMAVLRATMPQVARQLAPAKSQSAKADTRVASTPAKAASTTKPAAAKAALKVALNPRPAGAPSKARATATTTASRLNSVISSNGVRVKATRLVRADKSETQIVAHLTLAPSLPNLTPLPKTTPVVNANESLPVNLLADPPADNRVAAAPGLAPIPEGASENNDVFVTPNILPPTNVPAVSATYPMQSPLPPDIDPTARRPLYRVTQGMARLLAFKSNILSVFFSDDNVMDARAINARTIAVTGKGAGRSTLAVFLSRYPNDVVGRAVIYNIEVYPATAHAVPIGFTDPIEAETAIRTALNDPRVRVSVLQRPDGSLVAQLSGGLRDRAEVDASVATASLFVPNVISSLYVDPQAPSLEAALKGPALAGDDLLQSQLRSILNNDTIELVTLPGGTALKATVDTPEQAESILSILPSLSRRIQPFIVVRGSTSQTPFYTSEHPVLYGEDYEMTRRMNEVTGIDTVYAVRTARNALAVYGTVRSRMEYDTVRRYANALLPQLQESVTTTQVVPTTPAVPGAPAPVATTATTSSVAATAPALSAAAGLAASPSTANLTGLRPANLPNTASQSPIQLQMFVRVLDESASAIRLVTVESSVVEVSRTALRDLGVQVGSATLLNETNDAGTLTRDIDPTFNQGQGLFGSFGGTGEFSNINPLRVRLNALIQNGAARVLSRPNLTAVEGADAQITIGGARPLPSTQTNSSGGSTQTSLEFRRFGILLTMRPTVTDDDTIILQIRGDVTDLDFTTAINLGGAVIPGERVRSVDTTVTMHEGDTLVLGGLITNDTRKQTSKVPILGDIPILGSLFRSKRFENNETELAIFMTPHIRRQNASMNTKAGVELIPSLPDLPNLQDQQSTAFGLSTAGQGG